MRLEYDLRGDIAYISVSGADADGVVHRMEPIGASEEYDRGIDYDADDKIVGYELMNASLGLNLEGLPHRDDIAAFITRVTALQVLSKAS